MLFEVLLLADKLTGLVDCHVACQLFIVSSHVAVNCLELTTQVHLPEMYLSSSCHLYINIEHS